MTDTILNVATFPGDGIGPDVIESAIQIIKKASIKVDNLNINWDYIEAGATYYQKTGMDVEPNGEKKASEADAIFLGAIGLPTVRKKDGTEIAPHGPRRGGEFFVKPTFGNWLIYPSDQWHRPGIVQSNQYRFVLAVDLEYYP